MKQDSNSLTKGEMIEYLRENLSITIKKETEYYGRPAYVEIKLMLGTEVLSSDSFSVRN